jgi:hypothetical protein
MDIMAVLRYVSDHNETVFGTLVVLFLVTSMLLLLRQLGSKRAEGDAGVSNDAGGAIINIGEIETALKRVLASQSYAAEQAADAADGTAPAPVVRVETDPKLVQALKDRDAKIKQMEAELEQTRSIAAAMAAPTESAGGVDPAKLVELEEKLTELKSRLAEYEIIEDDIADLSIYKEENAKLKKSIEDMRAQLSAAGVAVAEAIDTPAAPAAAPAPAAKQSEEFKLDPNDDVMQEFASTVQVGKAPPAMSTNRLEPEAGTEIPVVETTTADADPLAVNEAIGTPGDPLEAGNPALEGEVDTDKMLTEVDILKVVDADEADALEDTLDTDKLMAEMSSLGLPTDPPAQAAAPAAKAAPAPAPAAVAKPAAPASGEETFEDDLLAEFKDTKQ